MSTTLDGLSASRGLTYGPAWVYHPAEIQVQKATCENPVQEISRLRGIVKIASEQLGRLYKKALKEVGEAEAEIFEAHAMFLEDPELMEMIEDTITNESVNADFAVEQSVESFAEMLSAMDSELFQARAQDIRDVGRRLVYLLNGYDPETVELPQTPIIIVADDLTPSDTMQFDRNVILGICTRKGGPTSHTAILSRSLGIPAAVSVPFKIEEIKNGMMMILDGETGTLIIDPSQEELLAAKEKKNQMVETWASAISEAMKPVITLDNVHVEVVANIGNITDAKQAIEHGAEGVGLLRTEFLYLDRSGSPSEEDQIKEYHAIAKVMEDRPIVVRTLDIGGDKEFSYLDLSAELNPFLGWRAIRMISERPEVLRTQFRALLRGFAGSKLRIMLPLVSNINEIRLAKKMYEEERGLLRKAGIKIAQDVQFGIMIEVPSAALMVEHFAEEVDFFSIGTNDLTQYTIAVDRTNERVASLASPFHPAVLKLIARTIDEAHKKGCWVGLCGEMAGDPVATEVLLGMGLDEFSMAPVSIPTVKAKLRQLNSNECREIAQKALSLPSTEEVLKFLASIH